MAELVGGGNGQRVAVVGCGAISHQHLSFLQGSPRVELVATCDLSASLADFARDRYGAKAAFVDVSAMLDSARPEVVHVLTPPHTHVELAQLVLERGAHVIVEKPLAPSYDETEMLVRKAREVGRAVVEGRNLLYNEQVEVIDALVAQGRLGELREVEVMLSLDLTAGAFGDRNLSGRAVSLRGGAVHDFLPHLTYLALHYLGCDQTPERVTGTLANLSGNPRVGADHLDAVVWVGNRRARLYVASDLAPDAFRLAVRGTAGSATTDFYHPFLRIEGGKNVGKRAPLEQLQFGARMLGTGIGNLRDKLLQHGSYHGVPRMLDDVYARLAAGLDPPFSDGELLASAALVDSLVDLADSSVKP